MSYVQDNWVQLLPMSKFTHNNYVHSAIGVSPFNANTGQHPRTTTYLSSSITDDTNTLAVHMKETDQFLRENLKIARQDMKRHADKHRSNAPAYKPGDKVMLSTLNITSHNPKTKWADKCLGPFKIIKKLHKGNNSDQS